MFDNKDNYLFLVIKGRGEMQKKEQYKGCLNKKYLLGFLGKAGSYFLKTFLNYKQQPISTSI